MFEESPIPYSGSKRRIFTDLWKAIGYYQYDHFVDVFCGSLSVSLNVTWKAKEIIANDIQKPLIILYEAIAKKDIKMEDVENFLTEKNELLKQHTTKEFFNLMKAEYNNAPKENLLNIFLLAHICYGGMVKFDEMLFKTGFGNKHFTKDGFSDAYCGKIKKFCRQLQNGKFSFTCLDFRQIDYSAFGEHDLLFFDPPYFVTNSFYNSSWQWTEEIDLYNILNELSAKKVNWILSNAIEKGDAINYTLQKWLEENKYHAIFPQIKYNMNSAREEIKEIMVFSNPLLFP